MDTLQWGDDIHVNKAKDDHRIGERQGSIYSHSVSQTDQQLRPSLSVAGDETQQAQGQVAMESTVLETGYSPPPRTEVERSTNPTPKVVAREL